MTPPESTAVGSAPAGRGDLARGWAPLRASALAGLALCVVETIYSWAQGWQHPADYLVLSAALTLGLTLGLGLLGSLLRLPVSATLVLWCGACGWAIGGLDDGAFLLVGAALATAVSAGCRRRGGLGSLELGACAGLVLACAYLKGPTVAEHLGHEDEAGWELAGTLAILGALLTLTPMVLARLPRRMGAGWRTSALLLLGCGLACKPLVDKADGTRRLPPADYARSSPRSQEVGTEARPNVFVLVLDTVRADHLSLYGYGRETTPELQRAVQSRPNAVVFPRAHANATWTVPSHASLFTGRLPGEHGAHFSLDGGVHFGFGISDRLPTLAERLREGGYATLAGYANHWLRSVEGMGRGFDRYLRSRDRDPLPLVGEALRARWLPGLLWGATKGGARADEVNATLLSMVEPWSQGPNPLYVFANYGDAHGPYAPPDPYRGRFMPSDIEERSRHLSLELDPSQRELLQARYDEELCYLDSQLGVLFGELDRLGLWRSSWVIVTSDHGEAFGEHGVLEHGTSVYDEVTHIPLIVFPPEGVSLPSGGGAVSLVDVAATVAAIAGVELGGPGRDLRQPATPSATSRIEFYGDALKAAHLGELARHPARAVVRGRYKLMSIEDELFLFDLDRDEGEHVNLASALPHVVQELLELLPEFGQPTFGRDGDAPRPEVLDQLRNLGYGGGPLQ